VVIKDGSKNSEDTKRKIERKHYYAVYRQIDSAEFYWASHGEFIVALKLSNVRLYTGRCR